MFRGTRALAWLFPMEFEDLDIKNLLTVMAAVKHWFGDLANLKVKILVDNQVCVALLNYGITRFDFLASCLREIQFFLAKINIELRVEYIPSRDNYLADLCSRAFTNNLAYSNFNMYLANKTLVLENIIYDKFHFEHDL